MAGLGQMVRRYERRRRFWKHVHVGGPDACWYWDGETGPDGGASYHGRPAERRAWELARGALPPGVRLTRRCDNPRCVNPEHLMPERG
jgi:hypothetical protein